MRPRLSFSGARPRLQGDSAKLQKWGGRYLLSDDPILQAQGISTRATVVSTGDLIIPTPINVQLRWARNTSPTSKVAILPFQYPVHGSISPSVIVEVRRGVDPTGAPTTDTYQLFTNDVFGIDIITARTLGVDIILPGGGSGATTWVEALATPVYDIGPKNLVYPWGVSQNPAFIAASATASTLLAANNDRMQFFVVNTSTNADLLIQLGRGPNLAAPTWTPNPIGSFVLPRNMFAQYESPCPCGFKGAVFGIWTAAPTGGAIIHEGTIF